MFADYLPSSTDSSIRNPRPNCQRSITSSGTRQYTTLINLTKSACLKPGEEHQPHAGGGPLSRDSQDKRSLQFVNQNLEDFSSHQSRIDTNDRAVAAVCGRRFRNLCLLVFIRSYDF